MSKSLLYLMLMATQLLSGSGGSIYLCVGSDGSYRIDAGPDSCTSCKATCGASCNASDQDGPRHGGLPCVSHGNDGLIQPVIETLADKESCDCTHIPITASSDQPTRIGRASMTVDFERLSSLAPQASGTSPAYLPAPPSSFHRCDTLAIPDFALTVVSTVIIRC